MNATTDLVFAPGSAEFQADPYAVYRRLLHEEPVHRTPDGIWVLSRYKDVSAALSNKKDIMIDPEQRLARFPPGPFQRFNRDSLTYMDPPRHTEVRRSAYTASSRGSRPSTTT